ncbi:hypothetical protein NK8_22160 [Caballeronia sp. NK8]|nr:hypothetical protein NK8_22160 [Caballeronia sp. NK8]
MCETHGDPQIDDRQPTDVKRPFEHPLRDKIECQKLADSRLTQRPALLVQRAAPYHTLWQA